MSWGCQSSVYCAGVRLAGPMSCRRCPCPDAGEQHRAAVAVRQAALSGLISHTVGCTCGAYLLRHRAIAAALLTAGGAAFAEWIGPLVR